MIASVDGSKIYTQIACIGAMTMEEEEEEEICSLQTTMMMLRKTGSTFNANLIMQY